MPTSTRLSKRSSGQFSTDNWTNEGDGLLESSKKVREIWGQHRSVISNKVAERNLGRKFEFETNDWPLLSGLPRSSMLLLGYAVEMYLKAGITKAYYGCSNDMFERDLKHRFGHNFNEMAEEISFTRDKGDTKNLHKLKKMVLVDARYPVFIKEGDSYSETINQQTSRIWSKEDYQSMVATVNKIRSYVKSIDNDSANPAYYVSFDIDNDGYLSFRTGGHLPTRITYRTSSAMRHRSETSISEVKAIFNSEYPSHKRLLNSWDHAFIYEDGSQPNGSAKTYRHKKP